jgi:GAF domain-containing protein
MKCPRCQQDNPSHAKFCLECGVPFSDKNGPSPGSYTDLQRALAEALEQQTATEEILRVISRSPTDLQPVLDTIARSAVSVCGATDALVSIREGDESVTAAHYGDQEVVALGQRRPIIRGLVVGRALLEARPVQVEDITQTDEFPEGRAIAIRMGHRTVMAVPLLRNGVAIGGILMRRSAVKPFTDKQISLLKTFADQAVIAIENVRLFNETKEALERQTATSEILRVISSSPTDVQPVFDAIAQSASRLCGAFDASIFRVDGDRLAFVAHHGPIAQRHGDFSLPLVRGTVGGRSVLESRTVQVADLQNEDREFPDAVENARRFGFRTILSVPLLREGIAIGGIQLRRTQVQLFSERQIALLQTFADQAVIAIENVRLFQQLEQKNEALTQAHAQVTAALDRQTATSEILRVISTSPTDLQPVFDTIVRSAVRLCSASHGGVYRVDGELVHSVAHDGFTPEQLDDWRKTWPRPATAPSVACQTIRTRSIVRIPDVETAAEAMKLTPATMTNLRARQSRSILSVPMFRQGEVIGAISLAHREIDGFSDGDVDLLQTFADQAVIAIENVRLFRELEGRNSELTAALDQQTATSEILGVISRSPIDAQPVFEAIVQSASRLCGGEDAIVTRFDGEFLHLVAQHSPRPGTADETATFFPQLPRREESPTARALVDAEVVHVPDVESEASAPSLRERHRRIGLRAIVAVPMVHEGRPSGVISVSRGTPGPFSDRQIALLQTFADQAVIAIENVRLFRELETKNHDLTTALEQQTATAEVLKVISRSTFDLQPVLDSLIENAARLCGARRGVILRRDGDSYHGVAFYNASPDLIDFVRRHPITPGRHSVTARVALERRTIHVVDVQVDSEHRYASHDVDPIRTELGVPMFRGDDILGVVILYKLEVEPFTDKQIELVETFADQAVIAIENVRLFRALEARNRDLTEALEQQTATEEILRVISRSPTDLQPVFDTITRHAVRVCDSTDAVVALVEGGESVIMAHYGDQGVPTVGQRRPIIRGLVLGRSLLEARAVHVEDLTSTDEFPEGRDLALRMGHRTIMAVPLLRDGVAIGGILMRRSEVKPFTDKQVALLQTFADQAVIAIENVRLFAELQEKNRQVTEALEQQTATSEILRVIAGSPTDLQPVLDALVESASRLCQAADTALLLVEGDRLRVAASHGYAEGGAIGLSNPIHRGWVAGRAVVDARTIHVNDLANAEADFPLGREIAVRLGHRTALATPLLREGAPIGALFLRRQQVRPFCDPEIGLLQTFADQAVIAIENVRLFNELEVANRDLKAASQHKSEFLANMSHELRTPLNAIIGFSEVLGERLFGELNEKQEEYLKDIHASGQHLLSLINDILDLSKIEAGRMELELAEFHFPQAIENALVLVRERALRRGITLEQSIDQRLGQIQGDERKIKQVLLNLLSNAIKFTPDGGRIEVRAIPVDGSVEVSVSDTGVGIAPGDQEAIFEEFRQVGTAAKKVEGTGLGLALSRKFIDLHGGRIWVTSQVGVGSAFTFTLPVRHGE